MKSFFKKYSVIQQFSIFCIVEIILFCVYLFSIPSDPKNAFFLGFSLERWILGFIEVGLSVPFIFFIREHKSVFGKIEQFFSLHKRRKVLEYLIPCVVFLFWIVFWFPPERIHDYAAIISRLKPLVVSFFLVITQTLLFIRYTFVLNQEKTSIKLRRFNRNQLIFVAVVIFLAVILYLILPLIPLPKVQDNLFLFAGTPFSSLQITIGLFTFFQVTQWEALWRRDKKPVWSKWFFFFLIWLIALILWNSVPLQCTADRLGPYPPNDACYPEAYDAVYAVGSHYITLGQGINNSRFTDKPLYMVFLALGQWLFGPKIDQYLLFQTLCLSAVPAILFFIGEQFIDRSGGLALAGFFILMEVNSLFFYGNLGTANVYTENSEILSLLLMVILFVTLFQWSKKTENFSLLLLTGGLFGYISLSRMNGFFVLPLTCLVILWLYRRQLRRGILLVCIMVLGFTIVFAPWMIMSHDEDGGNYYWNRIAGVIRVRYPSILDEPVKETPLEDVSVDRLEEGGTSLLDSMKGIVFHFLNNCYLSLARLPIHFSHHSLKTVIRHSVYNGPNFIPIWLQPLTIENLVLLILNGVTVCIGLLFAVQKHGFGGTIPLIIQLGYFMGNGFALTSGGRYIVPVFWTTLFYFTIGVYFIFAKILNKPISVIEKSSYILPDANGVALWRQNSKSLLLAFLVLVVMALIIPTTELVPERLSGEINDDAKQTAERFVLANGMTEEEWDEFIISDNALVVEGIAYHPRVYRGSEVYPENEAFEMLIFGDVHVFVSTSMQIKPMEYFSDESHVILMGCQHSKSTIWGVNRILMETFAIIQLDNEQQTFYDTEFNTSCP